MTPDMTRADIEAVATKLSDGVIEIPTRMGKREYDFRSTETIMSEASDAITQLLRQLDAVLAREAATQKRQDDRNDVAAADIARLKFALADAHAWIETMEGPP